MQRRERDKQRYVRITTLLMLDSGYSIEQTAIVLGIDSSTVDRLLERYEQSDTLEDYLHENYRAYRGLLTPVQLTEIIKELAENLHQSTAEVAEYIKKRYTVDYALSSIVALMRRLGFVYKKTRLVPAKADLCQPSRLNINGAINEHDVTGVVFREDERIDRTSVIALC